jgi:hypothetical protein
MSSIHRKVQKNEGFAIDDPPILVEKKMDKGEMEIRTPLFVTS